MKLQEVPYYGIALLESGEAAFISDEIDAMGLGPGHWAGITYLYDTETRNSFSNREQQVLQFGGNTSGHLFREEVLRYWKFDSATTKRYEAEIRRRIT